MNRNTIVIAALIGGGVYLLARSSATGGGGLFGNLFGPRLQPAGTSTRTGAAGTYSGTGITNPLTALIGGIESVGVTLAKVFTQPSKSAPTAGQTAAPTYQPIPQATLIGPDLTSTSPLTSTLIQAPSVADSGLWGFLPSTSPYESSLIYGPADLSSEANNV